MKAADTLAESLRAWAPMIASGYECPAASMPMLAAAELLTQLSSACRLFIGSRMNRPDDLCDGWALGELNEAYVRVKTVLEGA